MIWRILELVWAAVMLIGLPLSARSLGRLLRETPVERMEMYRSSVLSHVVLLVPTLLLDWAGDRAGIHLLLAGVPAMRLLFWTLGTVAACLALWVVMLFEARTRPRNSDQVVLGLLPRTRRELTAFFGVSLAAGFAEEYLLRGFCLGLLALATGSMVLAVVVTTLSFGLAHLYQGPRGAARATALGLVLAIPVVATGSLVPSIIAHAVTDAVSGRWTLGFLRRWGVTAE